MSTTEHRERTEYRADTATKDIVEEQPDDLDDDLTERLSEALAQSGETWESLRRKAGSEAFYDFEQAKERLAASASPDEIRSLVGHHGEADERKWNQLLESAALASEHRQEPSAEWRARWGDGDAARAAQNLSGAIDALNEISLYPPTGLHPDGWERFRQTAEILRETLAEITPGAPGAQETLDLCGARCALAGAELAEAAYGPPATPGLDAVGKIRAAQDLSDQRWQAAEEREGRPLGTDYRDSGLNRLRESMEALTGTTDGTASGGTQDHRELDWQDLTNPERAMMLSQRLREHGYAGLRGAVADLGQSDWLAKAAAQESVAAATHDYPRDTGTVGDRVYTIGEGALMAVPGEIDALSAAITRLQYAAMTPAERAQHSPITRAASRNWEATLGPDPEKRAATALVDETARGLAGLMEAPGGGMYPERRVTSETYREAITVERTWHSNDLAGWTKALEDSRRRLIGAAAERAREQNERMGNALRRRAGSAQDGELSERVVEFSARRAEESDAAAPNHGARLEHDALSALESARLEWALRTRPEAEVLRDLQENDNRYSDRDPAGFPKSLSEALTEAAATGRREAGALGEQLDHQPADQSPPLELTYNRGGRPENWPDAGDCVTRALAVATRQESGYTALWQEMTDERCRVEESDQKDADVGVTQAVYEPVYVRHGLRRVFSVHDGDWPVALDAREVPAATGGADCVIADMKHVAAVRDGRLHDLGNWTEDPGREPLSEIYAGADEADAVRKRIADYLVLRR